MKTKMFFVTILVLSLLLAGCASMQKPDGTMNKQGKGTAWGAAGGALAGAILGQAIGRDRQGTLWGVGVGAALGGLTGNRVGAYMDKQESEFERALAASEAASLQREGDNLRLSFKGDIFFRTNSAEISPAMYVELDRVADIMRRYPQTWIESQGHADPRGDDGYNLSLSQRRAEAAADYLASRGVDRSRIKSVGYGETRLKSGGNPDLYGADRRVEFLLLPMRQG